MADQLHKLNRFLLIGFLAIQSCGGDPQTLLNEAFDQSDLVKVKFVLDNEVVEGIQFTYSTPEEIAHLRTHLNPWVQGISDCQNEIGRMQFLLEEEPILEMSFNVNEQCNLAWLSSDGGFTFSDSLSVLFQNRYFMVRSVKGTPES